MAEADPARTDLPWWWRALRWASLVLAPAVILGAAELALALTRPYWRPTDAVTPRIILERQGGLQEYQRRVARSAAEDRWVLFSSERMYRRDRKLFWTLHPGIDLVARNWLAPREWGEVPTFRIRTDERGFRAPAPVPREGAVRIVCLGDSNTFGWGVDEDHTYPRQLARLLARSLPEVPVEVRNLGVPGYTSHQGLILFELELSRLAPRVAIFSFGFNDSRRSTTTDLALSRRRASWIGVLAAQASRLNLYQFLESVLGAGGAAPPAAARTAYRVPIPAYRRNLGHLVEIARERGIEPLLLALMMPRAYRSAMRQVGRELGVVVVDPMPKVAAVAAEIARGRIPAWLADAPGVPARARPGAPAVLADPVHLNALGQLVVAREVAGALALFLRPAAGGGGRAPPARRSPANRP